MTVRDLIKILNVFPNPEARILFYFNESDAIGYQSVEDVVGELDDDAFTLVCVFYSEKSDIIWLMPRE